MVKNKKGGSSHKKMASKFAKAVPIRRSLRLANPREPCEIYARVLNVYGGANVGVICNDGVERMCILRRKFRGRNKRDNQISINNLFYCRLSLMLRSYYVRNPSIRIRVSLL